MRLGLASACCTRAVQELYKGCTGHQPEPHAHQHQEDSPEEIGKRIASQWTHDPEAVGSLQAEEEEAEEEAAEEVVAGHEVAEEEALEAEEEEGDEEVSQEDLSDVVLEPLGA